MLKDVYKINKFLTLLDSEAKPQDFRSALGFTKNDVKYHTKFVGEYRHIVGKTPPLPKIQVETPLRIEGDSLPQPLPSQVFDNTIKDIEIMKKFLALVDSEATVKKYSSIGISKESLTKYLSNIPHYREVLNRYEELPTPLVKELPTSVKDSIPIFLPITVINDAIPRKRLLVPNGISIIVPTFNRLKNIKRCLYSIFNQKYSRTPVQLIIIDDGSTDGTNEYLRDIKAPNNIELEVHRIGIDNKTKWSSPAYSYNFGFTKVKYNYVVHHGVDMIYMDDNCLEALWKYIDLNRYVYFMQARIEENLIEKVPMNEHFFNAVNHYAHPTISTHFPFVAATSYDALKRIDFYSDGYGPGAGEDDELLDKLHIIFCEFTLITTHTTCHQDHPSGSQGCSSNSVIKSDGVQKLINRINTGITFTYRRINEEGL